MAANNEIGTLNPVAEIGRLCKERGILFHTDAAQAFGKVPFDVERRRGRSRLRHGAQALRARRESARSTSVRSGPRVTLSPIVFGGGHERGLRSGTLDVPGIVGFGAAVRLATEGREAEADRVGSLRDRLHARLAALPEVFLNGSPADRLAGQPEPPASPGSRATR